jgi:hypothetical protein
MRLLFLAVLAVTGCAPRVRTHATIPGCGGAEAYVPDGCYSVIIDGALEVRCGANKPHVFRCK